MNIGFDAKRAFHNNTGLGNYSRTLIKGLAEYYPQHQYYLFNPKSSTRFLKPPFSNVHEVRPESFFSKNFSSFWRSNLVKKDLKNLGIQLYHGLSHEIPFGIQNTGIPSVVTIHDLIFERYPQQYNKIDIQIYRTKFKYACGHADRIIAISNQTKQDLIELYNVNENKIDICYQSCDPEFGKTASVEEKEKLRKQLDLPSEFFLYVGSVIERKNLLNICKALKLVLPDINIPLVVIGNGKSYKQKVKFFLEENNLSDKVIFLSEIEAFATSLQTPKNMASIYQMAVAMIYPSFYEGFGIPVLEALWSRLPVITSNVSCLPETGGDGVYYIDPASEEEIATAMKRIYSEKELRNVLIEKGQAHAQNFTLQKCSEGLMNVYQKII
jgi:glycosyltransferase involved in cell wall biosynthesis